MIHILSLSNPSWPWWGNVTLLRSVTTTTQYLRSSIVVVLLSVFRLPCFPTNFPFIILDVIKERHRHRFWLCARTGLGRELRPFPSGRNLQRLLHKHLFANGFLAICFLSILMLYYYGIIVIVIIIIINSMYDLRP